MLLRLSSYIPALILKSQTLKFSHANNFSQINEFFVIHVFEHFDMRNVHCILYFVALLSVPVDLRVIFYCQNMIG